MIALHSDCLLFELPSGESVPCTSEMISVEIVGESHSAPDLEILRHAAASVFHYFKVELQRQTVTVGEFSRALEQVLSHLGYTIHATESRHANALEAADLCQLLRAAGDSRELLFYPRLRDELRGQLRRSPQVVRFHGLRGCVKDLAGARRWSRRCEQLQDQIVAYLRECFSAEPDQKNCALVVE